MKTSAKILIAVGGVLVAYLISGLIILRFDLQKVINNSKMGVKYETITRPEFSLIEVQSGWDLKISQSRDFSIEVQEGVPADLIQIENDRIIFGVRDSLETVSARIKLPILKRLEASGISLVRIAGFTQDSLEVSLSGQAIFTSADNEVVSIAIKTSDNAQVIIEDDPMD